MPAPQDIYGATNAPTSALTASTGQTGMDTDFYAIIAAAITAYAQNRSRKKSEQFAERMSSTAHQREVRDLRAAGLNPILSAGGGGASSPVIQPVQSNIVRSATSAAATSLLKKATTSNIGVNTALANKHDAETRNIDEQTRVSGAMGTKRQFELQEAEARARAWGWINSAARGAGAVKEMFQKGQGASPDAKSRTQWIPDTLKWMGFKNKPERQEIPRKKKKLRTKVRM